MEADGLKDGRLAADVLHLQMFERQPRWRLQLLL